MSDKSPEETRLFHADIQGYIEVYDPNVQV